MCSVPSVYFRYNQNLPEGVVGQLSKELASLVANATGAVQRVLVQDGDIDLKMEPSVDYEAFVHAASLDVKLPASMAKANTGETLNLILTEVRKIIWGFTPEYPVIQASISCYQ